MRLILARHGNTFASGEPVVWTGSSNDIPLVESGRAQAKAFAKELDSRGIAPSRILAGPLVRTREYADIVIAELKLEARLIVEPRLMEIDYGDWTGLTNQEVTERFSAEEQNAWNERSEWPQNARWGGSREGIIAEVKSLTTELEVNCNSGEDVLLVSSNGRIRYFLELIQGAFADYVAAGTFKVKTGAYCVLELHGSDWSVVEWNRVPNLKSIPEEE